MDFSRGVSTGRSCGPLAKHSFPTSTAEQALLMMTPSAHDGGGPKGAAPPHPTVVHALGSSSQAEASADLKKSRAALLDRGHVFATNFVVPETGALDVSALKDAVKSNAALRERLRIAREKADKEAAAFADWSDAKAAVAAAEDCLSLLVLPAVAAAEAAGLFQRASPAGSASAAATTPSGGLAVGAVSGAAAAAREAKALSALSLSPGQDDVALWRAVGYACRAIHASSLREPWVEWASSAGVFSREECAREWAAFTPPADSGGEWTTRDRAAAVKLLEALCEESRVARAAAATAALEQPPSAVHLLRVPALEAAPRFVYGGAEAIAAARLLSGSGYSPRAAAAGASDDHDDDDDGADAGATGAAVAPSRSAAGGAALPPSQAPIAGVPVPEGCPLHVIGGTGVGAEVVLQWFCGQELPEPSATAAPAAKPGAGVADGADDSGSDSDGYSDEFDDHDDADDASRGGSSDRKDGSSRGGSAAGRRKGKRRADAPPKSRKPQKQQLPYAIVLETCGITGGRDQVEGRWTQVCVDPPDPSAILSAPSASSFVPIDRAAQGLAADDCVPPAAAPGVDPFAIHRDGNATRMRGSVRITGLTPNTSYCYRARAFTRAGASHFAFIVVTTAPAPPPAPILARMSALPLPLLAPADVAEAKACRALPAASPTSLRLCWAPAPCRRANLMRVLRLFRLAAALTEVLHSRGAGGAGDAPGSAGSATADLAVLLRCVCKEYGAFSFLSLALANPRVWPRADGVLDPLTPAFTATAGAPSAEGAGAGDGFGFRPGAAAAASAAAATSLAGAGSRRLPCSVMEALQARLRAADARGRSRSRVISLPGLLSLFSADDARLTPHPGGGGRYLLHAPSRDALLLTMSASAAAGESSDAAAAFAGMVHGPTSAGESRYVLLRCASDGYGHAYDSAVPGAAAATSPRSPHSASAQVWQEVGAGVRSLRSVPELAPGTAYTFRVQAVNAEGIPSALSYAATAVTALPKVGALKTPSAAAAPSSGVATAGSVSSATSAGGGGGSDVTSANVTWAYDAPLAAAPRTSAVLLPDGIVVPSALGGGGAGGSAGSAGQAHVATLLKQVQARRGGGGAAAGTPRPGSAAASGGGGASGSTATSSESWLSLRRHWDRLLGLPSHSDGPGLALSAAVASDAIDAFQLRGLLADLGVLGECYGPPAAALARLMLTGASLAHATSASAGGGSAADGTASATATLSTAAVADALAGVGLSNVSRMRWLAALACLLPGVSADGLSLVAPATAPASVAAPPLGGASASSPLCPYDRFRLWWEGALADVDAAALLHAAGHAPPSSASADASSQRLPHGAGPSRLAPAPAVNVAQPLLYVVEVSRHESDDVDEPEGSGGGMAASGRGSAMLSSLTDPLGSFTSASLAAGPAGGTAMMTSSFGVRVGMGAAEDAAAPGWLPWRVHSVGGDCTFGLRDLAPNKQCRVRVTAVSRSAAAIASPVLPVCTRPLAPFAPVPIRTTPRAVSVRWYPAEGGAAKFILQIRRLGTVTALAAGAMKAAGSSSSAASAPLWHGRNVDEAVSRHMQVSGAVPVPGGRPPTPSGPGAAGDAALFGGLLGPGGPHSDGLWAEELAGGRSLVSSKGSRASGGSSSSSSGGATGWTVAYAGPQCFAVITGLSGSCVYRLRVLAEGSTGLLSVPSVETQIVTPPSGGLGPAAAATAAQYERTPDRAAVQFPLPVPSLRIDRAIAALAAGAYGGPAAGLGGPAASAAAAQLFLTAPLQLTAAAGDAEAHAFPCPDVVVGDCVVWTEPVCALLPRAVADAIEFHFIAGGGHHHHHDGHSHGPSTPPRSRAAREAEGAGGTLSAIALRALCQALASSVEDSRPWTAVPGAAAAASAAGFSPAALAEAGLRPVIVCRRTVAATVVLDSASGVSTGSAAVHTVDRRDFGGGEGHSGASATAGAVGLRASLSLRSAGDDRHHDDAGSVGSGDGSDSDADSLPGHGASAARTRAAGALLSAVDANPTARAEVARWHCRTLTLSIEWSSVGPPGDADAPDGLSAEAAAAFPCSMRALSRPYPPDVASSVSRRFGLSNGALVKRSGALLAQLGSFRAEWEDEAGRWSAAEEACASLLQRQ